MIKLLHSADWHLDSPIQGRTEEQTSLLKQALRQLPHQVVRTAIAEGCDLMLLSGDLFDGPCSPESLRALADALEEADMPVFIAPGNHDYYGPDSPWKRISWPENVHIFAADAIQSVTLPRLDCRVYGAAFVGPEADGILSGFRAEGTETVKLGVFHADPTQVSSPYCPVTAGQIAQSGLDYLALGHIHQGGSLRYGTTLCAWPGSPMGRGFDEVGERGVLIVTVDESCQARFVPLDTPRFYDWECEAGEDPSAALQALLPAVGNQDFYRVTLTGECGGADLEALTREFARFPNLQLRDKTVPPIEVWAAAGEDTQEGVYFRLLREAMEGQDEETCRRIQLAAKLSRQLLDGQEVKLP